MDSLPPKGTTELIGTLGFDGVEGGCPYLAAADGTRYQVMYPDGWRVDLATGVLTGPDAKQVPLGGQVTVRGAITDMLSTCQIGPIFQATEVISVGD